MLPVFESLKKNGIVRFEFPVKRGKEQVLPEWLENTKPFHMTVGDIKQMTPGTQYLFLLLNDESCELATKDNLRNVIRPPHVWFRKALWIAYTHDHGFQGNATYFTEGQDGSLSFFRLDVPVEFWVEYKPNQWFPLTNGKLRRLDMERYDLEYPEEFVLTDDVRVGIKGPMISPLCFGETHSLIKK